MASISNEIFTIQAKDEYEPFLETLLELLTEKAQNVKNFFGVNEYRPVKVSLFDTLFDLKDEANKTYKVYEEYAQGSFSNKGIGVLVDDNLSIDNLNKIVNKIIHQYSHIIYSSIYKDVFDRPVWLDEGIAQTLSGERNVLQNSQSKCKSAFLRKILSKYKEIPKIAYLNKAGNGRYTIGYPRYSGYLMSYFMVNYLLETKVIDNEANKDDYEIIGNRFNYYDSPVVRKNLEKNNTPLKSRYNMELMLKDPEYRKKVENFLVVRTVNYLGNKLGLRMSAASYKYIKTPQDILDYMDANFMYAWLDEKNEKNKSNEGFARRYHVASVNEVLNLSFGTEIEYSKFVITTLRKIGYEGSIFANVSTDQYKTFLSHIFVLFYDNIKDKVYYFEFPPSSNEGIYEFSSYKEFMDYYADKVDKNSRLYEMMNIPDGVTYKELMDFICSQDLVLGTLPNSTKGL